MPAATHAAPSLTNTVPDAFACIVTLSKVTGLAKTTPPFAKLYCVLM